MITAIVQTQHDETTVIEMPCEGYILGRQLWMRGLLHVRRNIIMRICRSI